MEKVAWVLLAGGAAILIGYALDDMVRGIGDFLGYEGVPVLIRVAVLAILAGLLLLVSVVVRDRIAERKRERFEEEER